MTGPFTLTTLVTFMDSSAAPALFGLAGILLAIGLALFETVRWIDAPRSARRRRTGACKVKHANQRASRSWDRDGLGRRHPPTPLADLHDFMEAIFIH